MSDSPNKGLPTRTSNARRKSENLVPPQPNLSDLNRDEWLKEAFEGFVSRGQANKKLYLIILETLWPASHGIPGPHVKETVLRSVIDNYRKEQGEEPYRDPFRRLRELIGEEGFTGIIKSGQTYQLVELTVGNKRVPRSGRKDSQWDDLLKAYNNKCAVCGRQFDSYQLDHKIPRLRGGNDDFENWQLLCAECNNFKSTACRGCSLECKVCPWAFPESSKPIVLSAEVTQTIRELARRSDKDPNKIISEALQDYLSRLTTPSE